mgnify:CR=1 FL=1
MRSRAFRLLALGLALLAGLPSAARAWSGVQHIQINKAAGRNVPEEMAGYAAFSRPMVLPGIYPDLWKESDLEEGPRHYFEPDRLPEGTDLRAISSNQAAAFAQIGLPPADVGIAPWTIADLLAQMTAAMRTNNWLWAARCGAAMGHYVADIHMPLHCTRNFNGQETWQSGVHERIESDMTKAFFRADQMAPAPAVYVENPFREAMGWIDHSAGLAPGFLRADIIAKRSANGRIDSESYYRKLWELTGETVVRQIDDAVTHLSSLWYTAWVDAGKPAVPEPFDELPTFSVHSGVGIDPPNEGGPVGTRQSRKNQRYDAIIWSVMGAIALVVIVSSLHRGAQERKAKKK